MHCMNASVGKSADAWMEASEEVGVVRRGGRAVARALFWEEGMFCKKTAVSVEHQGYTKPLYQNFRVYNSLLCKSQ